MNAATATVTARRKWAEKEEVSLLEAVEWVDENFPGSDGRLLLGKMGGKWNVVSSVLERESGVVATDEACKSRFHKIKRREVHKVVDGKDVIQFGDMDFPQADIALTAEKVNYTAVVRRVQELEAKVAKLEGIAKMVNALNDNFKSFFRTVSDDD
jgi:hypothetical protein